MKNLRWLPLGGAPIKKKVLEARYVSVATGKEPAAVELYTFPRLGGDRLDRLGIYGLPPLPPTSLTRRMSDGDRRSIFDDFQNFRFLSKIWFLGILGGHWTLADSGSFNLLCF